MWLLFAFLSAFFLGIYEINKKTSLTGNAVIPVLFLNTFFCSLIFLPALLLSRFAPETIQGSIFYVENIDLRSHLFIILKSFIVLISWGSAYVAIKHLPITLYAPLKSLQPALVLLGAMLIFGERLNLWQFAGIFVALVCFYMYSLAGKMEGISFRKNKWVWCLFLAMASGACSGLYDKFLMHRFDRMAVQVWYTIYQIFMMLPILVFVWYPKRKNSAPFHFRWSIIGISLFLCLSDFLYFYALSIPQSMVSIVSVIRRSDILVSFVAGALLFHDKNIKRKALILVGVIVGMILLSLGSILKQ